MYLLKIAYCNGVLVYSILNHLYCHSFCARGYIVCEKYTHARTHARTHTHTHARAHTHTEHNYVGHDFVFLQAFWLRYRSLRSRNRRPVPTAEQPHHHHRLVLHSLRSDCVLPSVIMLYSKISECIRIVGEA